jgi:LemA protein
MSLFVTMLGGFFAVIVVGAVVWYAVTAHNRLVRAEERCENAWADIDVVLKQRRDALEKLVDTVRQAMDYEASVLTEIVEAREQVRRAGSPREQAAADARVREALDRLAIRAEDHPDLAAVENLE